MAPKMQYAKSHQSHIRDRERAREREKASERETARESESEKEQESKALEMQCAMCRVILEREREREYHVCKESW